MTRESTIQPVADQEVDDEAPSSTPLVWGTDLTVADRCDRCCARAQVRWVREDSWIDTCAHHAREYADALLTWSHWLVDRRDDDDFAKD